MKEYLAGVSAGLRQMPAKFIKDVQCAVLVGVFGLLHICSFIWTPHPAMLHDNQSKEEDDDYLPENHPLRKLRKKKQGQESEFGIFHGLWINFKYLIWWVFQFHVKFYTDIGYVFTLALKFEIYCLTHPTDILEEFKFLRRLIKIATSEMISDAKKNITGLPLAFTNYFINILKFNMAKIGLEVKQISLEKENLLPNDYVEDNLIVSNDEEEIIIASNEGISSNIKENSDAEPSTCSGHFKSPCYVVGNIMGPCPVCSKQCNTAEENQIESCDGPSEDLETSKPDSITQIDDEEQRIIKEYEKELEMKFTRKKMADNASSMASEKLQASPSSRRRLKSLSSDRFVKTPLVDDLDENIETKDSEKLGGVMRSSSLGNFKRLGSPGEGRRSEGSAYGNWRLPSNLGIRRSSYDVQELTESSTHLPSYGSLSRGTRTSSAPRDLSPFSNSRSSMTNVEKYLKERRASQTRDVLSKYDIQQRNSVERNLSNSYFKSTMDNPYSLTSSIATSTHYTPSATTSTLVDRSSPSLSKAYDTIWKSSYASPALVRSRNTSPALVSLNKSREVSPELSWKSSFTRKDHSDLNLVNMSVRKEPDYGCTQKAYDSSCYGGSSRYEYKRPIGLTYNSRSRNVSPESSLRSKHGYNSRTSSPEALQRPSLGRFSRNTSPELTSVSSWKQYSSPSSRRSSFSSSAMPSFTNTTVNKSLIDAFLTRSVFRPSVAATSLSRASSTSVSREGSPLPLSRSSSTLGFSGGFSTTRMRQSVSPERYGRGRSETRFLMGTAFDKDYTSSRGRSENKYTSKATENRSARGTSEASAETRKSYSVSHQPKLGSKPISRSSSFRILGGKLVEGFSTSNSTESLGSVPTKSLSTHITRKDGSRQSLADFEASLVKQFKNKSGNT